ncbi:asparaginase [Candidatus Kirkpatrickella diaphorinae]|uniref:Asparaginase n=1 Tax=Candidatus Kirkpatrickella diaphorinae TaxID=2984322 RepID=A0ABY6GHM0_9PROT|nr:asparaginase [Candidatus Kirkpatrickella diaphorinae]UYH51007.1 asparaginase [Candidatus Kirkpatrickella diaphorinae]
MRHLIAEVERGGRVESRHYGSVAIIDASGRDVLALGDTTKAVFPRSTVKPLLALPLLESGAASRLKLTDAELAVICASHNGEEAHTRIVAGILQRIGKTVTCLECGAHWPLGEKACHDLAAQGRQPSALHNNCSGKHAGLVCLALDQQLDPENYVTPEHPVQKQVTAVLAEMTDTPHDAHNRGIDGCSMPTYAIPLRQLALGFARFGANNTLEADRGKAAARLRAAIAAAPFMLAGTGRFDTRLITHFGRRVFCKMGAEGVMVAALPDVGLGIAIKVEDGANRAAEVALAALLQKIPALTGSDEDHTIMASLSRAPLKNWNGLEVGCIRASETLSQLQLHSG